MKLNEKLSGLLHAAEHEHDHDCCGHEHDHDHGEEYKGGVDVFLTVRLVVSALLFAIALIFSKTPGWETVLLILSAIIAGYDVVIRAVKEVLHHHALDENVLMVVAALAAFIIGQTHEGAAVLILYQVGELLQSYAVGRARKSVEDSFGDRPETANAVRDGKEYNLNVKDIAVGETVVLRPGERVAFDCTVTDGESTMDMSSLTGESMPVSVAAGDELLSGSVNLTGVIYAEVRTPASESTAARILKIVQSEGANKGKTERFISRFARVYTPVVLALAVLAAILLPIICKIPFSDSIHRALVFLVISCPCALVISVPMAYFAGIGGAARHGMIFKSSAAVDAAAGAKHVVFDKTGTLTNGRLRVSAVRSDRMDSDMLLRIAAHAEAYSNHPIARAILEAYKGEVYIELLDSFLEQPGKGVRVDVGGKPILVGTAAWLRSQETVIPESEISEDIAVYMSIAGQYAGRILLSDDVKEDAAKAVDALEMYGCRTAMITGDSERAAGKVASQLGIREVHAACLPDNKAELVKSISAELSGKGTTLFVGEGLNDAPALLSADLGIAMGGLGSDAAIEAAGAIVLDDETMKVPGMIRVSRGVRKIVLENIAIALGIKLIVLILAAFGLAEMWMAVFADVGAAIITVVNAIRALKLQ